MTSDLRVLSLAWAPTSTKIAEAVNPDAGNAHLAVRTGEKMVAMGSQPKGGAGVDSDRELMPEGARSISQGLWRMVRLSQDAAESLDGRIEEET